MWLPAAIPGLVPRADTAARLISEQPALNASEDFLIPDTDPELKANTEPQFLLRVDGVVHPRVTNPDDPCPVVPWKLP